MPDFYPILSSPPNLTSLSHTPNSPIDVYHIRITEPRKHSSKIQRQGFPVAQCLRICHAMQRTWVQSLVWEDLTGCGAAKPVCHDY